jgi:hypothetical protein
MSSRARETVCASRLSMTPSSPGCKAGRSQCWVCMTNTSPEVPPPMVMTASRPSTDGTTDRAAPGCIGCLVRRPRSALLRRFRPASDAGFRSPGSVSSSQVQSGCSATRCFSTSTRSPWTVGHGPSLCGFAATGLVLRTRAVHCFTFVDRRRTVRRPTRWTRRTHGRPLRGCPGLPSRTRTGLTSGRGDPSPRHPRISQLGHHNPSRSRVLGTCRPSSSASPSASDAVPVRRKLTTHPVPTRPTMTRPGSPGDRNAHVETPAPP